jgi:transposase
VPYLIVNATTAPDPLPDGRTTPEIHEASSGRHLLPGLQIVEASYIDADLLMAMRRGCGVELVGPMQPDYHWQTKPGGPIRRPTSRSTGSAARPPARKAGTAGGGRRPSSPAAPIVYIKFSTTNCRSCPARSRCTPSDRRSLTLRRREGYEPLRNARSRQSTDEYRAEYARRAGIEGTMSQGVRAFGLRSSRYIGEAEARLQHLATATSPASAAD